MSRKGFNDCWEGGRRVRTEREALKTLVVFDIANDCRTNRMRPKGPRSQHRPASYTLIDFSCSAAARADLETGKKIGAKMVLQRENFVPGSDASVHKTCSYRHKLRQFDWFRHVHLISSP